jgi:hypothetical protein
VGTPSGVVSGKQNSHLLFIFYSFPYRIPNLNHKLLAQYQCCVLRTWALFLVKKNAAGVKRKERGEVILNKKLTLVSFSARKINFFGSKKVSFLSHLM